MKNENMLCIDYGSSYTKVATRLGWNEPARLSDNPDPSLDGVAFCFPSAVVLVEEAGQRTWLTGEKAMTAVRGRRFDNLKKKLLTCPDHEAGEYLEAATAFFAALKLRLEQRFQCGRAGAPAARVCIPSMGEEDERARCRIRAAVAAGGWQLAEDEGVLTEPEANVFGVLTRGRNHTWLPSHAYRPAEYMYPHYAKMFEDTKLLFHISQQGAVAMPEYGVLVTDIGAFTTDFGYIMVDRSFIDKEMPRPKVRQRSVQIGIRDLDKDILGAIDNRAASACLEASYEEWERLKRGLYAGKSIMVKPATGRPIVIGEGTEGKAIAKAVSCFAKKVLRERTTFCNWLRENGLRVHEEILTGGGFLVPGVRDELSAAVSEGGAEFRDLTVMGDGPDAEEKRLENGLLLRGAAAMGGCSVFFEIPGS